METNITVSTHKSVGPIQNLYDHGLTIFIQERSGEGVGMEITEGLWVCLDCGFTDMESQAFMHEDCERGDNQVNVTVRELFIAKEEEYSE